jgi:hypothetical protein
MNRGKHVFCDQPSPKIDNTTHVMLSIIKIR